MWNTVYLSFYLLLLPGAAFENVVCIKLYRDLVSTLRVLRQLVAHSTFLISVKFLLHLNTTKQNRLGVDFMH